MEDRAYQTWCENTRRAAQTIGHRLLFERDGSAIDVRCDRCGQRYPYLWHEGEHAYAMADGGVHAAITVPCPAGAA